MAGMFGGVPPYVVNGMDLNRANIGYINPQVSMYQGRFEKYIYPCIWCYVDYLQNFELKSVRSAKGKTAMKQKLKAENKLVNLVSFHFMHTTSLSAHDTKIFIIPQQELDCLRKRG